MFDFELFLLVKVGVIDLKNWIVMVLLICNWVWVEDDVLYELYVEYYG